MNLAEVYGTQLEEVLKAWDEERLHGPISPTIGCAKADRDEICDCEDVRECGSAYPRTLRPCTCLSPSGWNPLGHSHGCPMRIDLESPSPHGEEPGTNAVIAGGNSATRAPMARTTHRCRAVVKALDHDWCRRPAIRAVLGHWACAWHAKHPPALGWHPG
jgi:hypothetical protein